LSDLPLVLFAPGIEERLAADPASLPELRRLLARAEVSACAPGLDEALSDAAGWASCPSAALRWLGENGTPYSGWRCCADPVRLVADLSRVRMFPTAIADPAPYIQAFNAAFAADDLRLLIGADGYWYLAGAANLPPLSSASMSALVGGDIAAGLPRGEGGGYWRRLQSEAQILFHQLDGEGEANGLWCHGSGPLPVVPSGCRSLAGEHPLWRGLARFGGLPLSPVATATPGAWIFVDPETLVDVIDAVITEARRRALSLRLYPGDGRRIDWQPPRWRRLLASLYPT
jgi:hypothetical protein